MSLTSFLKNQGYTSFEGHCQQVSLQVDDLIHLTNTKSTVTSIMEIGFNAGHSADLFLRNNLNANVTSFDLGKHKYVSVAKKYIDITYPNRHSLILGDSTKTIPQFFKTNPNIRFDIIFIDGGHKYETVKSDLINCIHLAHNDSIIILDDTIFTKKWQEWWTIGPTQIWTECVSQNIINKLESREYQTGRGMSWGKYIDGTFKK